MGNPPETPGGRTPEAAQIDKWCVLQDLTCARRSFGLTDRDISLLQALLSFHKDRQLEGQRPLVVFAGNRSICERASGMPDSTMRRHLRKLVEVGIVKRQDSPNGKRYVRRKDGKATAFGLDLSPLVHRAAEIAERAEEIRKLDAKITNLRETAQLLRRDLVALIDRARKEHTAGPWDILSDLAREATKWLRRQLSVEDLQEVIHRLRDGIEQANRFLGLKTQEMTGSDVENDQHQQNSPKDYFFDTGESGALPTMPVVEVASGAETRNAEAVMGSLPPLHRILGVCSELSSFIQDTIRDWHGLCRAADTIRPMIGVSESVWNEAKSVMGPEHAAVTICVMLERFSEIQNPGGYMRSLTRKAREGKFSSPQMFSWWAKASFTSQSIKVVGPM